MKGRRQEVGPPSRQLRQSFAEAASATSQHRPSSRPFSVRLSASERQCLEEAAGSVPLGVHIRARLLDQPIAKASRRSKPDSVALGRILAMLGRSRLSTGVADLAAAARTGALILSPEMEAQVAALSREVAEIRRLLMQSLGLAKDGAP